MGGRNPQLEADLAAARELSSLGPWVRASERADRLMRRGDYVSARPILEKVLTEAPPGAARGNFRGKIVAQACYGLASIESLASVGKEAPRADPTKGVSEEEARRHRDAAFELLFRAVDLLDIDQRLVAGDQDLTALQSDPRWKSLLDRISH
jgi:hypothetical protein